MTLSGLCIGILQARHGRELAALFEREGALPILAPCMREVRSEDDETLRAQLAGLAEAPAEVFIFQTGVGTQALFELAAAAGLSDQLSANVREALVVARGPKPLAVLLRLGFEIGLRTTEPHTTDQLIPLLEHEQLTGRRVAVQHYGSANHALVHFLRERGAAVVELFSYRWALPDDLGPVHRLLDHLAAGELAVTAFTSASQVENLFTVAADAGVGSVLAGWLNERTITAAIGPTCAQALEQRGVRVVIQPERPKMVPLVHAIRDHIAG
jgi:uroporphyrinogen-III synthase